MCCLGWSSLSFQGVRLLVVNLVLISEFGGITFLNNSLTTWLFAFMYNTIMAQNPKHVLFHNSTFPFIFLLIPFLSFCYRTNIWGLVLLFLGFYFDCWCYKPTVFYNCKNTVKTFCAAFPWSGDLVFPSSHHCPNNCQGHV